MEPEISIFFLEIADPAFFQQINMALNDRSHEMWPQIRILSSMKGWDLGMGR